MTTEFEPDIFDGDPFDPEFVSAVQEQEQKTVETQDEGVKAYIARRARAYKAVFTAGERTQSDIDIVLADLLVFTRAMSTPWHDNQRKQDALIGRGEVFYRIKSNARLDNDTLFLLLTDAKTKMERR